MWLVSFPLQIRNIIQLLIDTFQLKNVTNFVRKNNEHTNFGAYAVVLPKQIAQSCEKEHEMILKRFEIQYNNVEIVYVKNDEVNCCISNNESYF